MATRLNLLADNLISQHFKLDGKIRATLQREVDKICEKWELQFWSGMGVFSFQFEDETILLEEIDHDGSVITRDLQNGDEITDSYIMNLLKDSELKELYNELTELIDVASRMADEMERGDSAWYLTGLNDYKGFRYNNGYPNPKPKTKPKYKTTLYIEQEKEKTKKQK